MKIAENNSLVSMGWSNLLAANVNRQMIRLINEKPFFWNEEARAGITLNLLWVVHRVDQIRR